MRTTMTYTLSLEPSRSKHDFQAGIQTQGFLYCVPLAMISILYYPEHDLSQKNNQEVLKNGDFSSHEDMGRIEVRKLYIYDRCNAFWLS